jgi:hypothetical protein
LSVEQSPLTDLVVLDQHGVQHKEEFGVQHVEESKIVQCAMEIGPLLGISCGGDGKQLLNLLTSLDKEHCQGVSATLSNRGTKSRSEFKNLECSINFEGSSCGKGKRAMLVL